jgi:hypothetical protein
MTMDDEYEFLNALDILKLLIVIDDNGFLKF